MPDCAKKFTNFVSFSLTTSIPLGVLPNLFEINEFDVFFGASPTMKLD